MKGELKADFTMNSVVREAIDACKIIKKNTTRTSDSGVRKCPVAHRTTDQEDFEHDFTTPGVQGNLECPFAKMAQNGLTPQFQNGMVDPIAAEFHPDHASVHSNQPSAQGPGKCPIRYLDQHSPEEVAKYFENHKHEIPRSHEICVRRYQQNEQSIRQLDAKYGNLVNMIQGLGVKHKQYLPEPGEDEELEEKHNGPGSVEAVEKWADSISHKATEPIVEGHEVADDMNHDTERKPHFERPLREIRVGESPSRPWGISVPLTQQPSKSAMLSDRGSEPVLLARSEVTVPKLVKDAPARRCPVDHGMNGAKPEINGDQEAKIPGNVDDRTLHAHSRPHIVFNGPVFFGYTAEQAATLLQSANFSNGHH